MVLRFLKDVWLGFKSFFQAFVLIYQYNLWLFFIIPVLVSALIYFGGDYLLEDLKHVHFDAEISKIDFQNELGEIKIQGVPTDSEELRLLLTASKLIFVIIALKLNKYLVLILLTPLNAMISARIERILTGNKYPFEFRQYVDDIYRGVNFAIRNLFRQSMIFVAWYLLTLLIPVLEVATFSVVFLVGAYYYGASLMDYTNERRRLSMEESVTFIRKHAGIAMAIGAVFYALFFVSFIGVVFAPIPGVVAATIAIDARVGLKRKNALKEVLKEKKEPTNAPKKSVKA